MIQRYLSFGLGCMFAGAVMLTGTGCGQRESHIEITGPFAGMYENKTEGPAVYTLHDGTQVVLSPKSKIMMDSLFDRGNRNVRVDGEASFVINRAGGDKFIIHTRNLNIEVLDGAKLHVDAFSSNAGEQTDLLTGRLRVTKTYHSSTDNEPEVLESGDMVMINRDIDLMEKEKMNKEELDKAKMKF